MKEEMKRMNETGTSCACLNVSYNPEHGDRLVKDRWTCELCGIEFIKTKLHEYLLSRESCENAALKQAIRDEGYTDYFAIGDKLKLLKEPASEGLALNEIQKKLLHAAKMSHEKNVLSVLKDVDLIEALDELSRLYCENTELKQVIAEWEKKEAAL